MLGEIPVIPLHLYQMCFANVPRKWTITQISCLFAFGKHSIILSTPFFELNHPPVHLDIAVFTLVIIQMQYMRVTHRGVNISSILNVVSRDAGIYFSIIASSHFLVVVLYSVARVGFFTGAGPDVC